jgi:GntR family transcriptional regulator
MPQNGQVTEPIGRPAYQQVADDLRRQIASGELAVGSAIPSTARLSEIYSVSVTVVRAAVTQLRADGLVVGYPGKGVYVSSTPAAVAEQATSVEDLANQIAELRAELRQTESARRREAAELATLRQQIEALQARVADLSGRLGEPGSDGGHPAPS